MILEADAVNGVHQVHATDLPIITPQEFLDSLWSLPQGERIATQLTCYDQHIDSIEDEFGITTLPSQGT